MKRIALALALLIALPFCAHLRAGEAELEVDRAEAAPPPPPPQTEEEALKELKERSPERYERLMQLKKERPGAYKHIMERARQKREMARKIFKGEMPKELRENFEKSAKLREEFRKLAQEYRDADPEQREEIKKKLRGTAETAFDLTTERRKLMIEEGSKRLQEAQERLKEAKESLKNRIENREEHIDDFVQKIIDGPRHKTTKPNKNKEEE